jgi:hypothetical protein
VSFALLPTSPGAGDRDVRYTPRGPIDALLASDPPPRGGYVLDPAAGDGAILRVLVEAGYQVAAHEIREEERAGLLAITSHVTIGDWLSPRRAYEKPAAIVANPPFSIAREFAASALECCEWVAFLLRLNTLGSRPWRQFWSEHPPTALRPIVRPSFTGDGRTDASEYLWVIWDDSDHPINMRPI